jgi:hypothetical protein
MGQRVTEAQRDLYLKEAKAMEAVEAYELAKRDLQRALDDEKMEKTNDDRNDDV